MRFATVVEERKFLEAYRSSLNPIDKKARILMVHRDCPFGRLARKVVAEFNREVPDDRKIDVIYLDRYEMTPTSFEAYNNFVEALREKYGRTHCPTLFFDGMLFEGILDEESYYFFLRMLDRLD